MLSKPASQWIRRSRGYFNDILIFCRHCRRVTAVAACSADTLVQVFKVVFRIKLNCTPLPTAVCHICVALAFGYSQIGIEVALRARINVSFEEIAGWIMGHRILMPYHVTNIFVHVIAVVKVLFVSQSWRSESVRTHFESCFDQVHASHLGKSSAQTVASGVYRCRWVFLLKPCNFLFDLANHVFLSSKEPWMNFARVTVWITFHERT